MYINNDYFNFFVKHDSLFKALGLKKVKDPLLRKKSLINKQNKFG